jgi:F420-non-reducing hydrogenase iron-sulfur subunit
MLKKVMQTLNIDPDRIQLSWISASEGKRYIQIANEFAEKIKKLGPNPVKLNSHI